MSMTNSTMWLKYVVIYHEHIYDKSTISVCMPIATSKVKIPNLRIISVSTTRVPLWKSYPVHEKVISVGMIYAVLPRCQRQECMCHQFICNKATVHIKYPDYVS